MARIICKRDKKYKMLIFVSKKSYATYKLICLLAVRQQWPLVLLLVLNKRLDVDVESLAGGTLGGLSGELALFKQQRKQGEEGVPGKH